ncbi:MAG: YfcE family phosphodiesterase [Anaerolineales bacterium]|nr:YfcE family phosphodiesterase [Anaerolineales bacterium]
MTPTILGVIADTHIPDRTDTIPKAALDVFSNSQVSAILHAGDLSVLRVKDLLDEIAPVYAVSGNTDLLLTRHLPPVRYLEFESVSIGLVHGFGGWLRYIWDKGNYFFYGPRKFSYYENLARRRVPACRVVVYGHTHVPANYWIDDQLVFNPGSPTQPNVTVPALRTSVGLLHLDQGNVRGEIVFV